MLIQPYITHFKSSFQFLFLALSGVLLQSCRAPAPPSLDFQQVKWRRYENTTAHYSLQYPDIYKLEEEKTGGALFRHNGVPLLVRFTDEIEGRLRGAWFGSKAAGEIELSGRKGLKYVYNHFDGPSYVRTIAYVVAHEGKYLGLEFRSDADELDKVQQKILASFTIGKAP